jgi:integrase
MIAVASRYCEERTVSADYRQALARVAKSMAAAGVTPLTIETPAFNRWLSSLSGSNTTKSNYRRMGLTLWRAALDTGLTEHPIGRIASVKATIPPPEAWSLDELRQLLDHIDTLRGSFARVSGCQHRAFWRAWVLLGYESGLRMSDLHNLRASAVRRGRLYVVAHKTGQPIGKRLTKECADAVDDLVARGDGQTVFRWALARTWLFIHFRQLVKDAGLRGSTKYLRRSGATHVEVAQPGSARAFLGHKSIGLAEKHYLDPTLMPDRTPIPPPILTRSSSSDQCPAFASS